MSFFYQNMLRKIKMLIMFLFIFAWSNAEYNSLVSISFALVILYVIYEVLIKKKFREIPFIPIIPSIFIWVYLLGVLVASLVVDDRGSIDIATKYIYWAIPYIFTFYICQKKEILPAIQWGIIVSVLFTAGASALQIYELWPNYIWYQHRIGGFYGNPNFYAVQLIMMIPFLSLLISESRNKQNIILEIFSWLSVVVGIVALFLTGSRASIMGLLIGFGVLILLVSIIKRKFKWLVCFLGFLVIIGIIFLNFEILIPNGVERNYDGERLLLWQSSYYMWLDHKVWGIGLDVWPTAYQQHYILPTAKERLLVMPHNNIAWYFSATGLVGGISFITFLVGMISYMFCSIVKNPKNIVMQSMLWAFIALSIQGMLDVGFTMKSSARYIFALLGISLASSYWSFEESNFKSLKK